MVTIRKPEGRLRELETERYILSTLPVLWLPFYRKDGSSFTSADGHGHVCTVTGAVWSLHGRILDRTDDNISVPNHAILNMGTATDFSLMVWFKADTNTTNYRYLITKQDGGGNGGYYLRLDITTGYLLVGINSAGTFKEVSDTTNHFNNTWTCTTLTVDRDSATGIKLYVNNVLVDTDDPTAVGDIDTTTTLKLGIMDDGTSYPFGGTIGEVLLEKGQAWSQDEVSRLVQEIQWRYR